MITYLLGSYPMVSQTFVYREMAALRQAGIEVPVWALERTDQPSHGILAPGSVRFVPRSRWCLRRAPLPAGLAESWAALGERAKDLRRAGWLARWLSQRQGGLHAHFLGFAAALGAAACLAARRPLVLTVHARGIHVPTPAGLWALGEAARVISISQDAAQACMTRAGAQSLVLPLAMEPCAATPPSGGDELHVVTVARAVPKKGYPVLRQALAGLELPWRWTVIGALQEEIGGPMAGLQALGPRPSAEVAACYERGADAFVLPCQPAPDGDRDGVPVAILEAMARGVPVITTAVGGIGELVEHGRTGLLVPAGDAKALREAIAELARDEPRRRQLGAAGREHVRSTRRPEARVQRLRKLFGELKEGEA